MRRCTTRRLAILCACALCLGTETGCQHSEKTAPTNAAPADAASVADTLGNPMLANRGDINAVNINVSSREELEKIDNGSNEELIWTDPDNPDADIPGLNEAFANRGSGTGWLDNYSQAVHLARRRELPLLIWFHDSVLSARSKELAETYLNTKEFDQWGRQRVVRLRLDSGAEISDESGNNVRYSIRKIATLSRTYGVKKKPAVVVVSPNGKVTARIDGYDGHLPDFIRNLGQGVLQAEQAYRDYKEKLRERGFRDWHSRINDKTLFAKVLRVDLKKQIVYLKEDGGRVSHTRISNLSQEDTDYLDDLRLKNDEKRRQKTEARDDDDNDDDEQI